MIAFWKVSITIVVIVVIVSAYAYYDYTTEMLGPPLTSEAFTQEKLIIEAVKVESKNTALLYVSKLENPVNANEIIHVNRAIIKDSKEITIYVDDTANATLTNSELTIIKVHFDILKSGTYTITLATEEGSYFVSPSFNIS